MRVLGISAKEDVVDGDEEELDEEADDSHHCKAQGTVLHDMHVFYSLVLYSTFACWLLAALDQMHAAVS